MIAVMDFHFLHLILEQPLRIDNGIGSKPWGGIDMGSLVSCFHGGGQLPPTGYAFFP